MARRSTPEPKREVTAFHERLKKLRIEQGLTQEEMALECDVDKTTVSHWELGIAAPRLDRISVVAKVLKEPVEDLIALYVEAKAS